MKLILGGAVALTLATSALAQAPTQFSPAGPTTFAPGSTQPIFPAVPLALALEAAKAAVVSCAGSHVGVVIIDQSGAIKLDYLPDGTSGFHSGMGLRKSSTALLLKARSGDVTARMAADPDLAAKYNANKAAYSTNAGGLPIMSNSGVLLGAIAVSGAEPSSKDEGCAADGLKAIQGRLN